MFSKPAHKNTDNPPGQIVHGVVRKVDPRPGPYECRSPMSATYGVGTGGTGRLAAVQFTAEPQRFCVDCRFYERSGEREPCKSCLPNAVELPGWQPIPA